MDVYLFTSDNQFGFKQKHSTDLCTVKSIIQYYNYYNSKLLINSGIGCFIDNVCFNPVFFMRTTYVLWRHVMFVDWRGVYNTT